MHINLWTKIFDNVLTTWACIYHCTWLVVPRGWRSLYDDIRSERKLFMVRNDNPHFSSHPVPTPPKELATPVPVPGPGAEICSSPGCGSCCFLWFLLRHSTGRTLMGWYLVLTLIRVDAGGELTLVPSKRGMHENRPEIRFSDFGSRRILTKSVGPIGCESKVFLARTHLANCRCCYLKPESSLSVVQLNTRRTRVCAKIWLSASKAEGASTTGGKKWLWIPRWLLGPRSPGIVGQKMHCSKWSCHQW